MATAQSVGVGTNKPAASAVLELSSTKQGFLPPRLTLPQRDSLKNPETGLMIFCTTCREMQVYSETGWKSIDGNNPCTLSGMGAPICSQVWMNKNLNVSTYRNGDPIPEVKDATEWRNLTTGAWCWYNNDSATYAATYGKLYNLYAIKDPRGLAPAGWHIPSYTEFTTLTDCLGGTTAGGMLKEPGTVHWQSPNTGANNSSGFTALPGGMRIGNGTANDFINMGFRACFWTTKPSTTKHFILALNYDDAAATMTIVELTSGISVRCVRD